MKTQLNKVLKEIKTMKETIKKGIQNTASLNEIQQEKEREFVQKYGMRTQDCFWFRS